MVSVMRRFSRVGPGVTPCRYHLPDAECVYTAHSKRLGGDQRKKKDYDKSLSADGKKPGLALCEGSTLGPVAPSRIIAMRKGKPLNDTVWHLSWAT